VKEAKMLLGLIVDISAISVTISQPSSVDLEQIVLYSIVIYSIIHFFWSVYQQCCVIRIA